jgi:hypothetical protein
MKKSIFIALPLFLAVVTFAATKPKSDSEKITYFECKVKEPAEKGKKTIDVTVRFAVKGLNLFEGKGELLQYPGSSEDAGMIYVSPDEVGKGKKAYVTIMSNLNGQGGDLRIEGSQIRLWGDGDGYQFTDLVIWNADSDDDVLEGYVHDYGSAYGKEETFKQFIKCKKSAKAF